MLCALLKILTANGYSRVVWRYISIWKGHPRLLLSSASALASKKSIPVIFEMGNARS
jgi:hypothetical protein